MHRSHSVGLLIAFGYSAIMIMITCARPSCGLVVDARGGIPKLVGRFSGAVRASSALNAGQVR